MMTRRLALSLALTVALSPAVSGPWPPSGPSPAQAAPEGKVTIAQGVDPTTLDPHLHLETPAANALLQI
jgi:ABC-type transport system substrate-binding protein